MSRHSSSRSEMHGFTDPMVFDDLIDVEVRVLNDCEWTYGPATVLRCEVASVKGPTSGAQLAPGVKLIKGRISSGGTRALWCVLIDAGTVFHLKMSKKIVDACATVDEDFEVKALNDAGGEKQDDSGD